MKAFVLFIVLAMSACSRKQNSAAPSSPSNAPSQASGTAAPSLAKGGTLPERLSRESNSRPVAALRAEDVFAAIVKNGVQMKQRTQYLGSPVGAAYCQSAMTTNDVSLTVCEFDSDPAAAKGQQTASTTIAVPNREILVHHATTLAIIQSPKSEASSKAAAAAAAAFNSL